MQTAAQLDISDVEFDALKVVSEGLRTGKYRHIIQPFDSVEANTGPVFNMAIAYDNYSCGQAACIGGWTALTMGIPPDEADDYVYSKEKQYDDATDQVIKPAALIKSLFFPGDDWEYEDITPVQAATAIDNFLDCGDPKWKAILGEAA